MSLVTAAIFGAIPFLISYYYVAMAFVWDWILFFIWCAVFATQHRIFSQQHKKELEKKYPYKGVDNMIAAQWVDLAAMLLFLISAIMGLVCLFLDHKNVFASRAVFP
jgi:multisubunit Na+/H+ antiporter MnhB subunit